MEKIILGSDPGGMELKKAVKEHLEKKGYGIIDIGMENQNKDMDYFVIGATAAKKIQNGEAEKAILFCGTGMGVSLVANKFKGIYASVVESEFTAKMSRAVNDSNILTMGGMVVSTHKAIIIVDAWLETNFKDGFEPKIGQYLENAVKEIEKIEDGVFK